MKELPKKAIQFEQEEIKISEMIEALNNVEKEGYKTIKPFIVNGNYKEETMDLEKLLRFYIK